MVRGFHSDTAGGVHRGDKSRDKKGALVLPLIRLVFHLTLLVASLAVLAACGGTTQPGSEESPAQDAGSDADGLVDADSPESGPSPMGISIVEANAYRYLPPQPPHHYDVNSDFVVRYDNSLGTTPTSATISSATWYVPQACPFDVKPESSGELSAGESREVTHEQVLPYFAPVECTQVVCGQEVTLEVTWIVAGKSVTASAQTIVFCPS